MTLFALHLPPPPLPPVDKTEDKRIFEILVKEAQDALARGDEEKAFTLLGVAVKALQP